ncbi:UdgX family uracil-DNA binding protein [Aureimonas frigidaquae]|uniref:UdgX family uracil-DNA binding protein n=1 Tax=Aureimonas frigidaquae TaxID=424757 RepID=UPI00078196C6|nr:UdgX family uracil-DNA binding protein [Aureimonas frigidaquae]
MFVATLAHAADFDGWRVAARAALAQGLTPEALTFVVEGEGTLFGENLSLSAGDASTIRVPKAFPDLARLVVCHRDPQRFNLCYRLLWRLQHERRLLEIASDVEVRRAYEMEKAVRRDSHKMKAFVRFREVVEGEGQSHFIAWFEPFHHVVELTAPFFMRRFTGMRWTILTPLRSVHWDGVELRYGPPAPESDKPADDAMETLWLTYYASIFNPARLKVKAMQAEMPQKYWHNLPEAQLIRPLIEGAEAASRRMIETAPTAPGLRHERSRERMDMAVAAARQDEAFGGFNKRPDTLDEARDQASRCRACPLWEPATQTVFGQGPANAPVIFVGEQPGDQEDLAGQPFIGPAGKVFDTALGQAGVDRRQVYVTNAVKHFKFVPRGKRRIHQKPNMGEVKVCRWWLDIERELVKPKLIVALGATAAAAVLGKSVTIRDTRSRLIDLDDGGRLLITVHPAYILRLPDPAAQKAEEQAFHADMALVKETVPEVAA